MIKRPTEAQFDETLLAISEQKKGTFELLDEANNLEPNETAITNFLNKKANLLMKKRVAVTNSPIPKWLLTQEMYQKGMRVAFRNSPRKKISRDEWVQSKLASYLNAYKSVPELNFRNQFYDDDPAYWQEDRVSDYLDSHNSVENRRKRFNDFVMRDLNSPGLSWEAFYITALYPHFCSVTVIQGRHRKHSELDSKIKSVEDLIVYLDTVDELFIRDIPDAKNTLMELKKSLISQKEFNDLFPVYIQSGNDTSPQRELLLKVWQWFEMKKIRVSGRTLHSILSIDGISQGLINIRAIENNIKTWREIEKQRK